MTALRKPIDPLETFTDKYKELPPKSRGRAVVADLIKDLRTKQMRKEQEAWNEIWTTLEADIAAAVEDDMGMYVEWPELGDVAFLRDGGLI